MLHLGKPSRAITRHVSVPGGVRCRTEILCGEKVIQIYRNIGHGKRVIISRDASAKIAKQPIMDLGEAVIVQEPVPVKTFDPEESREHVFEHLDPGLESLDDLMRRSGVPVRFWPSNIQPLIFSSSSIGGR